MSTNKMIKAIFFDYHGVLDRKTFKGLLKLAAKLSGNLESEIIEKYGSLGKRYASGKISSKIFWSMLERDPSIKPVVKDLKEYIFSTDLNKELWNLLPILKKKYILGIISDCPEEKARIISSTVDINKNFVACYFSCDYGLSKESQDFFDLIPMGFDFSKEECLIIDDSEENLKFAKSLGFQTQLYTGIDCIKKLL